MNGGGPEDPLDVLAALVRAHGQHPPLDRALVEFARVSRPEVDGAAVAKALDELADRVRAAGADGGPSGLAALRTVLFEEEGFEGDRETYYAPDNSYIDRVLERRRGIPISLAAVWLEVARRVGLEANGVGFPGHFLVRHRVDQVWRYVDVFEGGRVLELEDVRTLLRTAHGSGAEIEPAMLDPVTGRSILIRFAHNLKNAFTLKEDRMGIIGAIGRLLAVAPEMNTERRDRGLLYARLGLAQAALSDLRAYLSEAEVPELERSALERLLRQLEGRAGRMN